MWRWLKRPQVGVASRQVPVPVPVPLQVQVQVQVWAQARWLVRVSV
jgi:hypothetical protein